VWYESLNRCKVIHAFLYDCAITQPTQKGEVVSHPQQTKNYTCCKERVKTLGCCFVPHFECPIKCATEKGIVVQFHQTINRSRVTQEGAEKSTFHNPPLDCLIRRAGNESAVFELDDVLHP
jgi:hypothetical protein